MKKLLSMSVLLLACAPLFAQERPISQTEYVKMLYSIKGTAGIDAIVESVRRRGIAFPVTDGVRGLTRSKSSNNDDLKRAIEEAERRRLNPEAFSAPSEKEARALLDRSRQITVAAVSDMPDFVVKQQIQRAYAYAGTGNYTEADRLVVAVSYSENEGQKNKLLTVNGVIQTDPRSDDSFWGAGGYTSVGEFVGFLAGVFKPESDTRFELLTTDVVRGRRTIVWNYDIDSAKATYVIQSGMLKRTVRAGYKGRIWVDRENGRVLRLEMEAIQIPSDFPVKSVNRVIEYDWVKIANEQYLLPISADVRLVSEEGKVLAESRNRSRFRDYQKYGTEVTVVEEDTKPSEEEKPSN